MRGSGATTLLILMAAGGALVAGCTRSGGEPTQHAEPVVESAPSANAAVAERAAADAADAAVEAGRSATPPASSEDTGPHSTSDVASARTVPAHRGPQFDLACSGTDSLLSVPFEGHYIVDLKTKTWRTCFTPDDCTPDQPVQGIVSEGILFEDSPGGAKTMWFAEDGRLVSEDRRIGMSRHLKCTHPGAWPIAD
jgi:hypothetical protein